MYVCMHLRACIVYYVCVHYVCARVFVLVSIPDPPPPLGRESGTYIDYICLRVRSCLSAPPPLGKDLVPRLCLCVRSCLGTPPPLGRESRTKTTFVCVFLPECICCPAMHVCVI